MIPELLAWFTGKDQNKRKYPRKRVAYQAGYLVDTKLRPCVGIDISGGGCCILFQEDPGRTELDIRVILDNVPVEFRAKQSWRDQVNFQGKLVWRYGLQFQGIRADDWDAIIRFTTDRPVAEAGSRIVEEIEKIRLTPDEQDRLLPTALQNRLLRMLVQRGRLNKLDGGKTPLVQYFYSGIVRHEGRPMHRLTVNSKFIHPDGSSELFDTTFLFDDTGANVGILAEAQ